MRVYVRNLGGTPTIADLATQADMAPIQADIAAIEAGLAAIPFHDNYLTGLKLSNNGGDPANDIDIAPGVAADSGNTVMIRLAGSLTKRLDVAWAVGTNQGGLDTGSVANAVYYVWLILRSDTGVVDALFSLSATTPTMPAGYDQKRRIGAIVRSGGAILPFTQVGDRFLLTTPAQDTSTTIGASRSLIGTTVPPDMLGLFRVSAFNAGTTVSVIVQPPSEADAAPSFSVSPGLTLRSEVANQGDSAELEILVNASGQIAARAGAASTTLQVVTKGWIDRRGRDG